MRSTFDDMIKLVADWVFPLLIASVLSYITYTLGFDNQVKNVDKLFDNAIMFSSIILGFLGALLGILATIRNSSVVKEIFNSNKENIIKRYFYEAFISGFMIVLLSSILHIVLEMDRLVTKFLFISWYFSVFYFAISAYRIINILMGILFVSNKNKSRPDSNRIGDSAEREELRKKLTIKK
ncbi:hypothetical protein BHU72_11795 [Desulfuribacillus stibiiarsenatis]|uniref:Uncharacterized protein n=1 Tax=Desulfuribacillus stibiiarsenatis TaxID=1390249 RepID=A0A1E5L7S5_9FIRM|nr:hypothetical protein [Desulfuribacillus stibiiarsenatis]OEH86212.1 hypothetical protein BHU72_11795 [Desulfuribacillus stibiiarsenatis]